jgi:hypothetical protein
MGKLKILLFFSLLLTSCSSTDTIFITSELNLQEETKVDWVITKRDSIIDFRKNKIEFATIKGNTLVHMVSIDSIETYDLTELKTIHTFEDAPISIIILSSLAVAFVILNPSGPKSNG